MPRPNCPASVDDQRDRAAYQRAADHHLRLARVLARRGCPQGPEDLTQHDTLSFADLSTGDDWILRAKDRHTWSVRVRSQIHATNGDILSEMAAQGCGVINQPDFIVQRHIAAGRLVPILQDWSTEGFNLYALDLSRKFLSTKVRVFIDYLDEMEGKA